MYKWREMRFQFYYNFCKFSSSQNYEIVNDVKALRSVSSQVYFDPGEGQLFKISIIKPGKQDSCILAECFGLKAFRERLKLLETETANYIDRAKLTDKSWLRLTFSS